MTAHPHESGDRPDQGENDRCAPPRSSHIQDEVRAAVLRPRPLGCDPGNGFPRRVTWRERLRTPEGDEVVITAVARRSPSAILLRGSALVAMPSIAFRLGVLLQ